jgi:hypothetical protein
MAARCGFRNRYLDRAQVRYVCLNRVLPVEARQQDYHRMATHLEVHRLDLANMAGALLRRVPVGDSPRSRSRTPRPRRSISSNRRFSLQITSRCWGHTETSGHTNLLIKMVGRLFRSEASASVNFRTTIGVFRSILRRQIGGRPRFANKDYSAH